MFKTLSSKLRPSPSMAVSLLALLISLGGIGLAANGGPFILGASNAATARSLLSSSNDGDAFILRNTSSGPSATALSLLVKNGKTPFKVNSSVKVVNLNADRLDGLDSSAFASSTVEGWHYIGKAGQPAFENGWTNFDGAPTPNGANYQQAAYRIDALGMVHIRGLVKGGTIAQAIFRLPSSHCPFWHKVFPAIANNAFSRITVEYTPTPCRVLANFGSNTWVSLEGVSYPTYFRDLLAASAFSETDLAAFQPYLVRLQKAASAREQFDIMAEAVPSLSKPAADTLRTVMRTRLRR